MMRGTLAILLALCITAFCCRAIGRRAYLPPSVVPPLCRDEGILAYDGAPPSPFGVELNDSIGHMQDLMDSGCSNKLGRYLCTAHFPRLNLIRQGVDSESVYLRPCAELCRTIWRDCRPTARQLRVERTPEFECNKYFPLMKKWQCLSDLFPPNQPSNWITAVSRHSVEKASVRYLSPASTTQAIRIRFTNDTSSAVEREIFHLVDPEQGPPVRTIEIFPLWNPGSYSIEITALNDFGEGTTTIANIPAYEDAPNDVPDDHGGHCENITVPLCQSDIGYTKTSMPNFLHHQKQDDAGMEVHQFYPLVKVQCSPFIKTFLCSLYTPECTDGTSRPLQPCRELCGLAKDGCEELMNNFGFAWPEHLVCENFPSFSEGHDCYLGDASVNVTDDNHSVEDVPLCEDITLPLCRDIGYTKTSMPNILGHQTQDEAGLEVHQFFPLVKVQCSPFLKTLLCAVYTPQCTDGEKRPLLPCRELCAQARDGCEELMNDFGFAWPQSLACENFPSFSEGNDCYIGDASVNVTDDTHSVEDVPLCEDITLPLCRDIGYTKTSMPNILGHQTQDEAGLEVHQFFPLVKVQCSPFLKTLLCAVYTPQCTDGEKRPLLPCRELCAQARDGCEELMNDFGFAWPQSLACENFPSFSEGNDCYIGEGGVPQHCEDITVPMCMSDIGYTKTAMPNIFGHQLQDEAGLEIHQFWPLVEVGCSSFLKTLLCAVYTPECTEGSNSPNQPCRELCVPARDGCEGLIRAYGFSWPDSLMCENLPSFAEGNDCFLGGVPVTDTQPHERCQDITVSMCRSDVGYNYTAMPNPIGHQLQSDAELQLQTFVPLMQYGCSPHAGSFLCAMYLPLCDTSSGAQVLPCRELCDSVRRNCSTVLHEFGFSWPESLVCENLPSRNSGSTCYLGDMENYEPDPPIFNMTLLNYSSVVKPRRYDVHNLGVPSMFHGWVDVQGQGAANDYCRVVTNSTGGYLLSCSLAGMGGSQSDLNYNSTGSWFDAGHVDTWYMMDVNGDRRDDYCRCTGCIPATRVSCLLAGEGGFKTETLDYEPQPGGCHYRTVNPFFGR